MDEMDELTAFLDFFLHALDGFFTNDFLPHEFRDVLLTNQYDITYVYRNFNKDQKLIFLKAFIDFCKSEL